MSEELKDGEMTKEELSNLLDKVPAKPGKKRKCGLAPRRPEEDVPGADYMQRMTALGPRDGESYISFRVRLAGIAEGRKLVLAAARKSVGDPLDACVELGVGRNNLTSLLRTYGLTMQDIIKFKPENSF